MRSAGLVCNSLKCSEFGKKTLLQDGDSFKEIVSASKLVLLSGSVFTNFRLLKLHRHLLCMSPIGPWGHLKALLLATNYACSRGSLSLGLCDSPVWRRISRPLDQCKLAVQI